MKTLSEDNVNFALLPPKRRKRTDFSKCLICQKDTKEPLRVPKKPSIDSLVTALRKRLDDVYDRLEHDLDGLCTMSVTWHNTCYATCTSQKNFKSVEKRALSVLPTTSKALDFSKAKRKTRSASPQQIGQSASFVSKILTRKLSKQSKLVHLKLVKQSK